MENEKQRFQDRKKTLEQKLNQLSIKELGHKLIQEEDEIIHAIESHLFVERILKNEKIYDIDFLKVSISYLSLEALYQLAMQKDQVYLSYLANLQMDSILEKTFEKMDWQKEGEEVETIIVQSLNQKSTPIRSFITRYVGHSSMASSALLKGKITHEKLVRNAKYYHFPLEQVSSVNQEMIKTYQERLIFVQDDERRNQFYFDLEEYLQGYREENEANMYSNQDLENDILLEHPNRGYSKKVKDFYSRRGLYLKGGKRND